MIVVMTSLNNQRSKCVWYCLKPAAELLLSISIFSVVDARLGKSLVQPYEVSLGASAWQSSMFQPITAASE